MEIIEVKKKKKLVYGNELLDRENEEEIIVPREVVKTGDSDVVI